MLIKGYNLFSFLRLFLFFIFEITIVSAQPTIEILITEAKEKQLYLNPQWRALLYYTPTTATASIIDDQRFFLSPNGKTNLEEELNATLDEFFKNTKENESPQCRFRARFLWLNQFLDFSAKGFTIASCPRFNDRYQSVNPESITLIFPSAFLNNPASSFGHTLLRIDQAGQKADSKLLAYTASYAAAVNDEDAMVEPGAEIILRLRNVFHAK